MIARSHRMPHEQRRQSRPAAAAYARRLLTPVSDCYAYGLHYTYSLLRPPTCFSLLDIVSQLANPARAKHQL
jgi:hypothetical protein